MKFYEFTQNNSGGSFVENKNLCRRLFIEARNSDKAKEKAIRLGVYFDGVEDGTDCGCCGDRWSEPDEVEIPYRYGTFDKDEAEGIAEQYKADVGKTTWEKTTWKGMNTPEPDEYDVVFRNVESYAQYLADKYSCIRKGNVEARIFYADGKKIDIWKED